MDITFIYVDYRDDTNLTKFNSIYQFVRNLNFNLSVVYVNNRSNKFLDEYFKDSNITYIESDNFQDEFSGWDDGIKYVKKKKINFDYVLFANSAYPEYHSLYTFDSSLIIKKVSCSDYIGIKNIFHPSMNIEFKNDTIDCWINTSFFFLSEKSLRHLNYELNKFNLKNYNEEIKFNQLTNQICNIGLYTHIDNWINKYDKYNFRYRKKFLNILNEKFLHYELKKNKNFKIAYLNDVN